MLEGSNKIIIYQRNFAYGYSIICVECWKLKWQYVTARFKMSLCFLLKSSVTCLQNAH